MTPFRAWWLPPDLGFRPGSSVTVDTREGGRIEHLELSADRIEELAVGLRSAREEGLGSYPVERMVGSVDQVARMLLDSSAALRDRALEGLENHAGYSGPMAVSVLDGMAEGWTADPLRELVCAEFPDPAVLDGFQPAWAGGRERALGYPLTFHLGAGSVPGVAVTSLIRALLVKSAVVLKPGRGDVTLPVLFAEGLGGVDPELARNVAVAYWPGPTGGQTEAFLAKADLVVVYGGDDTVRWVRDRLPVQTPLRAYRHRLGVGVVGREALDGDEKGLARRTARHAARAISLFDQRGCVSPHVLFVECGGEVNPEKWAALLGEALGEMEQELPSGRISPEDGATLQQLRGAAEIEEDAGHALVHHGGREAPWTVVVQAEGRLVPSCLNRTVRVFPVEDLARVPAELEAWADVLQTVGVAGLGARESSFCEALVHLGVSRIAPLARIPWPRPWWHHDGAGPLQSLVRWTDVEEED